MILSFPLVQREGGRSAPWYVEWRQDGKRHSIKAGKKKTAETVRQRKEVEVIDGKLGLPIKKRWATFRKEYEQTILPQMPSVRSRTEVRHVLNKFEEVASPQFVRSITRKMLDEYVAKRLSMPGKKKGDTISPETVNKELRTLRA
ncbi:MAG: hypothetical protein QF363_16205, partial [Planctomycetaceae bacterium]|nr:hypothetical protein [Planctomycetaceae bacterium]